MNIEHANRIPMSEILGKLHRQPQRTRNTKLWYLSPLRAEKTASFQVDTQTNRWHDFGEGIGGDLVDFVCAYLKSTREEYTVSDALRWIRNMGDAPYEIAPVYANTDEVPKDESVLILKTKKPIQHLGLIHYLEKRGIPVSIANRYLKELRVHNTQTKKNFYALGFANEEGGFELRNPFFKGCLGAKAITFVRGRTPKPNSIHLFEGFIDYLSMISQLNGKRFKADVIILNSLACLKQATPYIRNYGYHIAYSWMDNDKAGEQATASLTEFFQTESDLKHTPMNKVYAPHKDVNAWHMHKLNLIL
ncbi:toprim domain-containing protein [Larkinella bovis]|uniref:Toprim domain-containing protein n=1 Tax=Larkinella bovis TaxID=683041 RepID=A0ABW0IEE6_9BACT